MKKAIVAVVVVLLAAGGIFWWVKRPKQSPVHYDTSKITRGAIIARVTATGTLSALVTVQVGSQVSGRIQKIFVDFNSPVKKGQLIAKIDPQLYAAALEQAKANLLAAQGQLEKAEAQAVDAQRQWQRNKELRQQNLIAQADLDTSEANARAATANVGAMKGSLEQAKASAHQASVNLAYTDIMSPTDGVVISRAVDVGQTVAAQFQAPILFTIAQDLTKMQVDTSVAEADVGKLRPGMEASFTVDAYPTEKFKGTVRQIRNAPQTVQNVVTYDAVIDVDNTDLKLKPGMTANVTYVYAEKLDVLRVANAALRFRPPPELLQPKGKAAAPSGGAVAAERPRHAAPSGGGSRPNGAGAWGAGGAGKPPEAGSDRRQVWILDGQTPRPVNIRIGVSDGTQSEVVEGEVHEGDLAITDVISKGGGMPGGPRFRGF